jgi:amino acid adenylation domain-containing protein
MVLPMVMSRDGVDETTLIEIAEACHVSPDQIEDIYECTPLQNRAMAESAIHSGASVFQFVLSLGPSVDRDWWCTALRRVVSLNSVLRTRLVDCRLGLVQVVTSEEHYTQRRSGDVEQYMRDDKAQPLGLGVPLFRSAIIDRKWVLTMHHAVMDQSSLACLFRDVLSIYHGHAPETRTPFKEFVAYCLSIDESMAKSFWASRFKGAPAIFPKVEPGYAPNATQKVSLKVTWNRIGAGVSLAHIPSFIEAAWALTARAYTGSESIAFGLVLSGRAPALAGLQTTLGPTIATIPVQVNLQRSMSVEGIIRERTIALRQLQTQPALQYNMARIRAVSDAARIASGFQTLLNIRPSFYDPDESAELIYEYMDDPNGGFGLCLYCNLQSDGILVEAMSDPAILCERQLRRIVYQFEHALQSLMEADCQTKLGQLRLLNPHDRLEILRWNKTAPETVEKCIHELFSTRAREQPAAVAVEAWDGSVSYRELDEMSNRLALELRRRGLSIGHLVPFIFEKSLWTVVAIFAIMKAGGACVPIDKSHPHARKAAIVSSAHAKTVLTSSAELANSSDLAPDVFAVSAASISGLPDVPGSLEDVICSPGDLAYIMFTSGSTGVPKGVMLEHRCLASSLSSQAQRFGWQPGCRMLQFAAHVWDISMGEIFGALLFGGCLCIPSEEARESRLADFIESSKVNWAWFTPTVLRTISPEDTPSLQSMISAGEPVGADAAKTWGRALRFINGWGPTETSILSSVAELTPASRHPESIGTPVGCAIWIVNPANANELAPIGAVGEILVEGPGVARGYLDDHARTAASFIPPPPWAPSRERKPRHFYRTGDLARYHPDGSICFIGRRDSQVKIRGQRFELGELESVINGCGKVKDVFIATKILAGRTELVAVICFADPELSRGAVLQEPSDADTELAAQHLCAIRDHVRARLPSYMVPTIWLAVEQMPQTESGKLDRAAISAWLRTKDLLSVRAALDARMTGSLTPPATAEERLLQLVWSSVLALPQRDIGRESSFMQLGGDSILAMQVASRCRKRGLQTTTAALLRGESLAAIAESSLTIEPAGDEVAVSPNAIPENDRLVEPAVAIPSIFNSRLSQLGWSNARFQSENIERVFPATDAQAFMLAVGQPGDKAYHIEFKLEFRPGLDPARLRRACEQVVQHHPVLRTVFFQHGPALHQAVLKGLPTETVVEVDERNNPPPSVTFHEGTALARFHLFSDGHICHCLSLDIHHAIYDALSLELVFRDLDAGYTGRPLSDGLHFHSWVLHVEALDRSTPREYWRGVLQGSSMSYLVRPFAEATQGHPLDEQIRIRVPLQNLQTSVGTPSSVMKAAWALLLFYALGKEDIVFGEVSTNRYLPVPGLDEVRGPCVNFLPVRARLDQGITVASLVTQIQDQSTAGLPYHHLGFRSIIRDCTAWPCWTRFSSALAYQNHGALKPSIRIGDANCALLGHGKLGDSADISVIATPGSEDLEIELNYSSHTFPSEQIRWISRSLVTIVEGMPSFLEQNLSQVEDSLRSSVGSYVVPTSPAPPPDLSNGHVQPPLAQEQEIVLEGWRELELLSEDQIDDCSMFSCGADVVTALLLSKYYLYCGYDISTKDIVQHPSRSMQAYLLNLKKMELENLLDSVSI